MPTKDLKLTYKRAAAVPGADEKNFADEAAVGDLQIKNDGVVWMVYQTNKEGVYEKVNIEGEPSLARVGDE